MEYIDKFKNINGHYENVFQSSQFVSQTKRFYSEIQHEIYVSPIISWGHSLVTATKQQYDDLFLDADAMMYKANQVTHQFRRSGLFVDVFEDS